MRRSPSRCELEVGDHEHQTRGNQTGLTPQDDGVVESAAMNSMPFFGFAWVLLFGLAGLAWYVAVIVLLYRILQELKRIRA
jgi:hypothetical protein